MNELSPAQVVTAFSRAWDRGDLNEALTYIGEDAVYQLHISETLLPFGGETRGRDAIASVLADIRRQFDYVLYRAFPPVVDGNVARYQVEFIYRHIETGEILDGRLRIVAEVSGGVLTRVEEYHDRAKVEAFMKLISATSSSVDPPGFADNGPTPEAPGKQLEPVSR